MPDYTIYDDEPPPDPRPGGKRSKLSDNLFEVAKVAPKWRRIATYASAQSASAVTSELRSGKKAAHRPEGTWEFKSKRTTDNRFGVWARLLTPDADADAQPDE